MYAAVALAALGIGWALGRNPLETEPWLTESLSSRGRDAVSVAGGVLLAVASVRATRAFVRRFRWARMLHADLRPAIRHASGRALLVLGVASGTAEELFFRGILTPAIGLTLSAVVFGAVHLLRLRGRAGLVWGAWATAMGWMFGGLFIATGSLVGAIVAHASINALNLRFVRDTELDPKPRRLGGLLG